MPVNSTTDSSRLDDITTVGKMLIREPGRDGVQEAFEQERRQIRSESQTTPEMDEVTSQSESRRRRVLGITFGLTAIGFLLRRRTQLREAMPFGETSTTNDTATLRGEKADASTSSEMQVETGHETSTDSR